jgi:glycosyltransferase involved in cell wall biosynthesis
VSDPSISVVMAVLDGELYLREALDSVVAQEYSLEIVVVDGGSQDHSVEIASSYEQVRCITQSGEGLGNAWNEGVAASVGGLIAFLDSDDRWMPDKLSAQLRLLDAKPKLAGVIGMVRFFREPREPLPDGFRRELLEGEHLGRMPGALLVRRQVWDQVGEFMERYRIAVDVDWFARLKDAGHKLGIVPELVMEKRVHGSNLSSSDLDLLTREMSSLFRASIARQKANDEH